MTEAEALERIAYSLDTVIMVLIAMLVVQFARAIKSGSK